MASPCPINSRVLPVKEYALDAPPFILTKGAPGKTTPPPKAKNRKTCQDPLLGLHELFLLKCPPKTLSSPIQLSEPETAKRLDHLQMHYLTPLFSWLVPILQNIRISDTQLAGSCARYLGGAELLKNLFLSLSHELEPSAKHETLRHIQTLEFPFSDIDLHFILPQCDNPFLQLEEIKKAVLDNLPLDTRLRVAPVDRVKIDPKDRVVDSYLKIELIKGDCCFDLIFESPKPDSRLFGSHDLKYSLNTHTFSSPNFYRYCEGQIFRVLWREINPDSSIHRRLLLSQTRGFFAPPNLLEDAKQKAKDLSGQERDQSAKNTVDSHLKRSFHASWIYHLAHHAAWKTPPDSHFPGGHVITETLNAAHSVGMETAYALLNIIGLIALLENHTQEMAAFVHKDQIKLVFPKGYALWMPLDPTSSLKTLSKASFKEWDTLKNVLRCMPCWIPRGGPVGPDYIDSVKAALPQLKLETLHHSLNKKPCKLLRLRLQAALNCYGAAPIKLSKRFWKKAPSQEDLDLLLLEEMTRSPDQELSQKQIASARRALKKANRPDLCMGLAEALIQRRDERAVDFLKLIEEHPINWEPVSEEIKKTGSLAKVTRRLHLQRLIVSGPTAVPADMLQNLLTEVKDKNAIERIANQLIDQQDREVFLSGVQLMEQLGLQSNCIDKIIQRIDEIEDERLVDYSLRKLIPLTEKVIDRVLGTSFDLRTKVILLQRYKGPNRQTRWNKIAIQLTYAPNTWPASWKDLPDLDPRVQTLWTGVVRQIQKTQFKKAEQAIRSLLLNDIEPPGGKAAFVAWLHHHHAQKSLIELFGMGNKVDQLLNGDSNIEAVLETVLSLSGTVRMGGKTFAGKLLEKRLDQNLDPWPVYLKLGKRGLSDKVRARWISRCSPAQLHELLPPFTPRHPLLSSLKQKEVIEELSHHPNTHPWVYSLLLDGPLNKWPKKMLAEVIERLIEDRANPRQIELIAVYGERLPSYQAIWERVAFRQSETAIASTVVWLQQGICPVALHRLHIRAKQPHPSASELLQSLISHGEYELALTLWKRVPFLRKKTFLPLAKKLFMQVENKKLTEWVLRNAPQDEEVVLRAAALPLDKSSVLKYLIPSLGSIRRDGKQQVVSCKLVQCLKPEEYTIELISHMIGAGMSSRSAIILVEHAIELAKDSFHWIGIAWLLVAYLKEEHDIWRPIEWKRIYDYLTDERKTLITIKHYNRVYELMFDSPYLKSWIHSEAYWELLRCYCIAARENGQFEKCRQLLEDAVKRLPKRARKVGFLCLDNLYFQHAGNYQSTSNLIMLMSQNGWIDSRKEFLFNLFAMGARLEDAPCNEDSLRAIRFYTLNFINANSIIRNYANVLWERMPRTECNVYRSMAVLLRVLPTIALRSTEENQHIAKEIISKLHNLMNYPPLSNFPWPTYLKNSYLKLLLSSRKQLPHWLTEHIAGVFIYSPQLLYSIDADDIILKLVQIALASGPSPDREPGDPNLTMQLAYSVFTVANSNPLVSCRILPQMRAGIGFLCGALPDDIIRTVPDCTARVDGFMSAMQQLSLDSENGDLGLWKWYRDRMVRQLLTAPRAGIVLLPEEIKKCCDHIKKLITRICPAEERDAAEQAHINFLRSEPLKALFTPPLEELKRIIPNKTERKKILHTYKCMPETLVSSFLKPE